MAEDIQVQNIDVVLRNIISFGGGFLNNVNKAMDESTDALYETMSVNIALTDHSLKELAKMGHPYARRAPQQIHNPFWQVHQQSGKLYNARIKRVKKASTDSGSTFGVIVEARGEVGVDSGRAPEAVHVIFGTNKMIARPFLTESLNLSKDKIESIFHKRLRLK